MRWRQAEPEDRTHTVELSYQARPWSRPRRVVLVIEERPLELLPHYFFLVTNASAEEEDGLDLVQRYRQRGATEKDYGEWTNALEVALSSTNRPKETYRGERPRERTEPVDSFAVDEAGRNRKKQGAGQSCFLEAHPPAPRTGRNRKKRGAPGRSHSGRERSSPVSLQSGRGGPGRPRSGRRPFN